MTSASPVTGTSGSATSETFAPQPGRAVCLTLTGAWSGTVTVLKSRDRGASFTPMTVAGSAWATYSANCDEAFDEPGDDDVRYRLLIALTSGNVTYRLGH